MKNMSQFGIAALARAGFLVWNSGNFVVFFPSRLSSSLVIETAATELLV